MKKILCIIAATALLGTTVFAGDEEASKKRDAQITGELGNVADLLTDGNIENTPMLLVNPDAYIGKLFPSIPFYSRNLSIWNNLQNSRSCRSYEKCNLYYDRRT